MNSGRIIATVCMAVISISFFCQAEAEPPLRIGVISILSGDYAVVGNGSMRAVKLAAKEYAKKPGSRSVELVYEDDGFDPKKGLAAFYKLTQTKPSVDAIINVSSPTIGAIAPRVKQLGLPVLQSGNEPYEPIADTVFQISPGYIPAEKAFGEYIKNTNPTEVILVYTLNDTMVRFAKGFQDGYGAANLTSFEIAPEEKDIRTVALKIVQKKPKRVVILAFPVQGATLTKELLSLGLSPELLAFDSNIQTGLTDYKKLLPNINAIKEAAVLMIPDTTDPTFIKAFEDEYSEKPPTFSEYGYDAFNVLVENYSPDRNEWSKKIAAANLKGITGKISFDEVGVRNPEFEFGTVKTILK